LLPARRLNALRAWLLQTLSGPVPQTLLQRLVDELGKARTATWPAPTGAVLRLHRDLLDLAPAPASAALPELHAQPSARSSRADLGAPGVYAWPAWQGQLVVDAVASGGVSARHLRGVEARARSGGERFCLATRGTARSLKKQYQARQVPSWGRDGPLLYTADGQLLFVPGLGLDARLLAPAGEPQLMLIWQAGAPGPRQSGR
jgi:tRNA(Ile)-lysidine synthase